MPAPSAIVPTPCNATASASKRAASRAATTWYAATIASTLAKRCPGASASQCAATSRRTPAPSSTAPAASSSATGQRPPPDGDAAVVSNSWMRRAVGASTSPARCQRSSLRSHSAPTPLQAYSPTPRVESASIHPRHQAPRLGAIRRVLCPELRREEDFLRIHPLHDDPDRRQHEQQAEATAK